MMTRYRGELVASMWATYGTGPDQLLEMGVPIGDVADMAVHLPRKSPVKMAITPLEEIELWDVNSGLLAALFDAVAQGNWQRGGGRGPRPRPIPRPVSRYETERVLSELRRFKEIYEATGSRKLAELPDLD